MKKTRVVRACVVPAFSRLTIARPAATTSPPLRATAKTTSRRWLDRRAVRDERRRGEPADGVAARAAAPEIVDPRQLARRRRGFADRASHLLRLAGRGIWSLTHTPRRGGARHSTRARVEPGVSLR